MLAPNMLAPNGMYAPNMCAPNVYAPSMCAPNPQSFFQFNPMTGGFHAVPAVMSAPQRAASIAPASEEKK
eukprot:4777779-Pleurochrysis_carterae.AAC.1